MTADALLVFGLLFVTVVPFFSDRNIQAYHPPIG